MTFSLARKKGELMSSKKYESNQLYPIIDSLFSEQQSGILSLKTQASILSNQNFGSLVLRNGTLVYGSLNITGIPNNIELCKTLGEQLNPNVINAALSVASKKINNLNSTKELIDLLQKMKVFTWEQVEAYVTKQVVLALERFVIHPGTAEWQAGEEIDLDYGVDNHGLNWSEIKSHVKQRQQKWLTYQNQIPSMDAIPTVTSAQLKQITSSQVKEHFQNSIDGKRTLANIADKIGTDPLKVAKNYHNWAKNGWVKFVTSPIANSGSPTETLPKSSPSTATQSQSTKAVVESSENLPAVLSVDDSPIIQLSIKRALQHQYQVLLADKAEAALKILDEHPVKLLLLDLTMPDMDGLQFCKTLRQNPKFQTLPVVMVTARDGFVNKAKGHLAGTDKYLTKPFKPEELQAVVQQYITK